MSKLPTITLLAVLLAACQNGGNEGNKPLEVPTPGPFSITTIGDQSRCRDPELKLFDNTNAEEVLNGGPAPTFDTRNFNPTPPGTSPGTNVKSRRYCLIRIETYHWNKGQGTPPGKIGLTDAFGQEVPPGPWQAIGTPGQQNVPDANWVATVTTPPPGVVLIQGEYTVNDSSKATWSGNAKAGKTFARVFVKEYDEGP